MFAFCALGFIGLLAIASPPVEVPVFETVPFVSDVTASVIAADAAVVAIIAIAVATIAGLALTIARQRGRPWCRD